ncbi:MAG: glycerol kinase GlpK [Spirochaetaceae bacterium]|jgi:glycerol kinase|nr:glycerol kinase GlpK [Spirochaetaceae bacterium]
MGAYVLALDQGTASSRALLFNQEQHVLGIAQKEVSTRYPQEGWVEQDPMEIYESQYTVMMELLKKQRVSLNEITAIGLANQRETTILWDRQTGRPLYNAILWQCRRTAPLVDRLIRDGLGDPIRKTTGLVPDAYFSGTKIAWLLDHLEGSRARARRGEILFGTVDTWLIWNLSGGEVHATDYTNASRTMLYNIHTRQWDAELLAALDIPQAMLPEVKPSGSFFGMARLPGAALPLAGNAGDQQAALFGQCCFTPGEVKNTYGTGCFLLMHTGNRAVASQNGLLTTLAAGLDDQLQYALEGSVFVGGAVIKWLRDELGLISLSEQAGEYARQVPNTGGVYLVPAFTGLGAPHWDMYARGAILGISRGTTRAHIIRAAEEAIAYQSLEVMQAMEKDTGIPLRVLKVDGGASGDDFLMRFQADITGAVIRRPVVRETTALGAAYLAGITRGFWRDAEEVRSQRKEDATFTPRMDRPTREALIAGWRQAVERVRSSPQA